VLLARELEALGVLEPFGEALESKEEENASLDVVTPAGKTNSIDEPDG
jgi:hypothetical protein